MTQDEAVEKVRPLLDGKVLEDVQKEHLQDESSYNWNFYRLSDGTKIHVKTDEFYETDEIYLVDGKNEIYVGYCICFKKIVITKWFPT